MNMIDYCLAVKQSSGTDESQFENELRTRWLMH